MSYIGVLMISFIVAALVCGFIAVSMARWFDDE